MTSCAGAIDCDIHPAVPATQVLLPYLDEYWREAVLTRGIDRLNLDLTAYPPSAPSSGRPDWRPAKGNPGTDLGLAQRQALDHFGTRFAICNLLHGAQILHSEDMGAVFCRAINDWLAAEWLARESRLRASILVPIQSVELSVAEIERRADDPRFVQVLVLAMGENLLGKRAFWPIYEAAERHDLPIGVHAGSSYRHAPTSLGWPSYYLEDYVSYSAGFESQLLSLVSEGVFAKFPRLKVVLIESGVAWLPGFLWRADKTWRGVRAEVPWVKEAPSAIIRRHVRLTVQPFDAPPEEDQLEVLLEQIGSDDMLLFATDYPHWQFDGDDVLPKAFPASLARKIMIDNPLATYSRLAAMAGKEAAS